MLSASDLSSSGTESAEDKLEWLGEFVGGENTLDCVGVTIVSGRDRFSGELPKFISDLFEFFLDSFAAECVLPFLRVGCMLWVWYIWVRGSIALSIRKMSPPLSLLFLRITDGDPSFSKSDDLWSEVILSYIALRFVFSVSLCDREEELESLCLREEELESLCLREEEL